MITIDAHRCPQNHHCPAIAKCPAGAISQQGHNLPVVDHGQCTLCQTCVEFCPRDAIQDV